MITKLKSFLYAWMPVLRIGGVFIIAFLSPRFFTTYVFDAKKNTVKEELAPPLVAQHKTLSNPYTIAQSPAKKPPHKSLFETLRTLSNTRHKTMLALNNKRIYSPKIA